MSRLLELVGIAYCVKTTSSGATGRAGPVSAAPGPAFLAPAPGVAAAAAPVPEGFAGAAGAGVAGAALLATWVTTGAGLSTGDIGSGLTTGEPDTTARATTVATVSPARATT